MNFWNFLGKRTVKESEVSTYPVVKKYPVRLFVHMTSNNYEPIEHTINIPKGGSFEESYGGKIKVFDSEKNVVRIFNPQAGYSVDIDIIYDSIIIYFNEAQYKKFTKKDK